MRIIQGSQWGAEVIRFEHVTKRYPQRGDALSNLSFELKAGEMAFLTGHSGAGKSTLLRLIGLIERLTRTGQNRLPSLGIFEP